MACPGSVYHMAGRSLPQTEYSEAGTRKHEVCKAILTAEDWESVKREASEEDLALAIDYAKKAHEITNEIVMKHKMRHEEIIKKVEEMVTASSIHPECGGTPDLLIFADFGPLHVLDLKTGWESVSPEGNLQEIIYAIGAIDTYEIEPTSVHLHIYQSSRDEWKRYDITMDELRQHRDKIKAQVISIEGDGGLQKAPGDHCVYCCKSGCNMFGEVTKRETGLSLSPVDKELMPVRTPDGGYSLTDCSMSVLLRIDRWGDMLIKAVKDARAIIFEKAMNGEKIRGKKLVKAMSNSKWKPEITAETLANGLGVSKDEVVVSKPIGITLARKLAKTDEAKAFLENAVIREEKGAKLVDESAGGEPYTQPSFEDIVGEEVSLEDL